MHTLFYGGFREKDIVFLQNYRRKYNLLENNPDRNTRREAQKEIRATTFILDYILGRGADYRKCPLEMQDRVKRILDTLYLNYLEENHPQ